MALFITGLYSGFCFRKVLVNEIRACSEKGDMVNAPMVTALYSDINNNIPAKVPRKREMITLLNELKNKNSKIKIKMGIRNMAEGLVNIMDAMVAAQNTQIRFDLEWSP
jgi:hypothetical protein